MSWNKPSEAPKPAQKKKPGAMRGAIAGLAVVAILGVAAFFIFGGKDAKPKTEKDEKKPAKLAEVKPAFVATNAVEEVKKTPEKKHDYRYDVVEGAYRDERGVLRTPTGRRILEAPPSRHIKLFDDQRKPVFKNLAENEILRLLTLKPGHFAMPSHYGVAFEKSLIACINTPVEIGPDDSPELAEKKKAVQEAKEVLKARIDNGEVAGEIMKQTLDEFRQLSVYRNDLIKMVREQAMGENVTEQDLDTYVESANKLLKERGLDPIKDKSLHRYRLKMLQRETGGKK